MVAIPIGNGDWESQSQNLPRIRFRNCYITQNPSSYDGYSRISRPTLRRFAELPETRPVQGVWGREGIFDQDFFAVCGDNLYRVSSDGENITNVGEVPGTGIAEFASRTDTDLKDALLIVRDGVIYFYNEDNFFRVEIPNDLRALSIASINNFFIITIENAQQFYWIAPGETTIDPLDFASAERNPDNIVAVRIIGDEIWFISREGPEVWTSVLNFNPVTDIPFQRINGRVYKEGCLSRDTVVSLNFNSLPAACWLSNKGAVIIAQGSTQRVSNESIEELLRTATNARCWYFRYNRHDFYIVNTDQFGLAFDLNNQTWLRWDSNKRENWRAHLGSQVESQVVAGDSESNVLWELEEGLDDDGELVIRELSGFLPHVSRPVPCYDVYINLNMGWAPDYDTEPVLELRWSDDQGATYTNYIQTTLGSKGQYANQAIFRSLGRIRAPGRLFQFRFTEKARFRLDYALVNEINSNGSQS